MLRLIEKNDDLIIIALKNPPSLIIDAGNAANPHRFYNHMENFRSTYVVAVDAIYRFRDTLLHADDMAKKIGAGVIVVTHFDKLFNFQDDMENRDVLEHCREIITRLSGRYDIYVHEASFAP